MVGRNETWLTGLIGRGIGGSRSRQMHEREAASLGLQLVYRLIDVDRLGIADSDLETILATAEVMGFSGVNITYPFKQAVIECLDILSPDAKALGAVNTVRFAGGKREGFNTDWSGFATCVQTQLGDVLCGTIAQIGAGGAGSATAYAALKKGANEVWVYDCDFAKADALVERLAAAFPKQKIVQSATPQDAIGGASGVIQATPVGMASLPGMPFDPALLKADQWLADVIYFPQKTELVENAKSSGIRAIGGSPMAIYQAAGAFEIFTGHTPDTNRMLADFGESL